jgi:phenylacetate-coenzyme A ligase PaaK-like adenylate-forming protein
MSNLIELLYSNSPIWAQQIMVSTYGWWWFRRRFSKYFLQLVDEYKSRDSWTKEQFRDHQSMLLQELLDAAWGSPYYRQIFLESGITRETPPLEALARLPLLTRETVRTRAKEMLTANPLPAGVIVRKLRGTTSSPTELYFTRESYDAEMAVPEARNLHWAGVNYRDRRAIFGVRKVCRFAQDYPPFWRVSPAGDMAYASIYYLSPKYLPHYLAFLRKYKPPVIMGYPGALNIVARYALENKDMPAPAKAVLTTSETVTDRIREAIEAAWQCRIYDRYYCAENAFFASECQYGRYHVSPDVGIIEIVDANGKQCPPGVIGDVVCTGLSNRLQPLIRYRIGDVASWAIDQDCPCERNMPILESIENRFGDICYTADGLRVIRFDTVFSDVDNIREAQIAQERLKVFTVFVVPSNGFNDRDIEKIKRNMRRHVGDVRTYVEVVHSIARSSSGKLRAVVCNLPAVERSSPQ